MGEIKSLSFHGMVDGQRIERAHRSDTLPLSAGSMEYRLLEMEKENRRLHKLVAELLIKNQQLRDGMMASPGAGRQT